MLDCLENTFSAISCTRRVFIRSPPNSWSHDLTTLRMLNCKGIFHISNGLAIVRLQIFGEEGKQEVCYSVFRMRLSGRRGRIQMRVQRMFIGTTNIYSASTGSQRWTESYATQMVRSPRRTSVTAGRSNELARLLANPSERLSRPQRVRS